MNIKHCPYIDRKCGEHAQCRRCADTNKIRYFCESEINRRYVVLEVDEAFYENNRSITALYWAGLITGIDETELREINRKLYTPFK